MMVTVMRCVLVQYEPPQKRIFGFSLVLINLIVVVADAAAKQRRQKHTAFLDYGGVQPQLQQWSQVCFYFSRAEEKETLCGLRAAAAC